MMTLTMKNLKKASILTSSNHRLFRHARFRRAFFYPRVLQTENFPLIETNQENRLVYFAAKIQPHKNCSICSTRIFLLSIPKESQRNFSNSIAEDSNCPSSPLCPHMVSLRRILNLADSSRKPRNIQVDINHTHFGREV